MSKYLFMLAHSAGVIASLDCGFRGLWAPGPAVGFAIMNFALVICWAYQIGRVIRED